MFHEHGAVRYTTGDENNACMYWFKNPLAAEKGAGISLALTVPVYL
jgi:hypothetical protein